MNQDRWRALKKKYHDARRANDPKWVEAERKRSRDYVRALRLEVLDAYGGRRCSCCGETELSFLSIDHIAEDGAAHRRLLGYRDRSGSGGGTRTLQWIKANGFPPGFQVLCFNCNHGKHVNGGICPHQKLQTSKCGS
jgi:hypothetical protein